MLKTLIACAVASVTFMLALPVYADTNMDPKIVTNGAPAAQPATTAVAPSLPTSNPQAAAIAPTSVNKSTVNTASPTPATTASPTPVNTASPTNAETKPAVAPVNPTVSAATPAPSAPKSPIVLALAGAVANPPPPPSSFTPAQQTDIENVIHSYLVKHPEVILEAIQALQQKQMEETRKTIQKTQESSPKYADEIFHQAGDPFIGNPNGKVIVVDFFDYQCPHCIEMLPVLEALIKSNPEVRVVFKEFPIRGPNSEFASKAALAAKLQGKYFEFHKALMQQETAKPEALTEDSILKAAKTTGLNIEKLKADMKTDAINQQIKNNYKLGQSLQLIGTPAFFIAKSSVSGKTAKVTDIDFVPGRADIEQFKTVIKKYQ